jgi:hypothetical protein
MAAKQNPSEFPTEPLQEIPIGPDSPLVLTALREDNPRDFLAALGLLDLLDKLYPAMELSLAWTNNGHPSLESRLAFPNDWLSNLVLQIRQMNDSEPHPFVHNKIIKVSHKDFREAVGRSISFHGKSKIGGTLPSALYAAFASQVHELEKTEISPTAFSFSNAQSGKELLRDIKELILTEFTFSGLIALLTNDPVRRKAAKSFRWHPAELRSAAYRAHDPGEKVKGDVILDFPCANIFAFFGLVFYPVADTANRELTLGMTQIRSLGDFFTWPVWGCKLVRDVVPSLLHHSLLHDKNNMRFALSSLGLTGKYRSIRQKVGKAPTISLYFSPAEKIF